MMQFELYVATCLKTGKQYVGATSLGRSRRWRNHLLAAKAGSRCLLHKAIRKYGEETFVVEHVASALSWHDACEVERELIQQYNCHYPNGYNMTRGGDGAAGLRHSENSRRRMSKATKTWWATHRISDVRRAKASASQRELRRRLDQATAERRKADALSALEKARAAMLENKEEYSKKLSAALKARWAAYSAEERRARCERIAAARGMKSAQQQREKMRASWASLTPEARKAIGMRISVAKRGVPMSARHAAAQKAATAAAASRQRPEDEKHRRALALRAAWKRRMEADVAACMGG